MVGDGKWKGVAPGRTVGAHGGTGMQRGENAVTVAGGFPSANKMISGCYL